MKIDIEIYRNMINARLEAWQRHLLDKNTWRPFEYVSGETDEQFTKRAERGIEYLCEKAEWQNETVVAEKLYKLRDFISERPMCEKKIIRDCDDILESIETGVSQ